MADSYVFLTPDGKAAALWSGSAAPTKADLDVFSKQHGGAAPSVFQWRGAQPPTQDDLAGLRKNISNGSAAVARAAQPAEPSPVKTGLEKASGITGPRTFMEAASAQYKALKTTLYNAIPSLTATAGGAVGLTMGAPTAAVSGPVGPALSSVIGAGGGAMLGRYVQHVIDHYTGGTPMPSLAETAKSLGKESQSQMLAEMGGNLIAMPLGFVMRGGFLPVSREVGEAVISNEKYGTRLSGPELASGTTAGDIAKSLQSYAGGAMYGGVQQARIRAEGTRNATDALDEAVNSLTTYASKSGSEPEVSDVERTVENAQRGYAGPERRGAMTPHQLGEWIYREASRTGRRFTDEEISQMHRTGRPLYTGTERRAAQTVGERAADLRREGIQPKGVTEGGPAMVNDAIRKERAATGGIESQMPTSGPSSPQMAAGQAAETGLAGAKAGLKATGKQMSEIIAAAPPLEMKPIKDEAYRLFQDRIIPLLKDFPDVAGNPKVADLIRSLRQNPEYIQRMPRPEMTLLADAVLEKVNSPVIKTLRTIMGAEDTVSFKAATQMRTMLRKAGAGEAGALLPKKEAAALARKFEGTFTEELFKASPEYKAASQSYAEGANLLRTKQIDKVFKLATTEPEAVLQYLKRDTPTRARLLRKALLDQAGKGPEAAKARAAFDVIRSQWLKDAIVKGDVEGMYGRLQAAEKGGVIKELFDDPVGKQMLSAMRDATTESDKNAAKAAFDQYRAQRFRDDVIQGEMDGMLDRLKKADADGVLKELYGDDAGQRMLANAREIATLMSKHATATSGNLRKIFEITRMISLGLGTVGAVTGGKLPSAGAVASASAFEVFPDFFIWAIHDPRATKWFLQGVRAEDPKVSSAATIRLMELFRQTHEAGVPPRQTQGRPQ